MKLHSIASAGGGDIAGLMGLQSPGPVGLIYNPRSAGNRGRVPIRVPGIPSASPETRQELARALADFARREVRVVIVCGGDGTIREVLSAIPSAYLGAPTPGLAIVAAGNTDLIAGEVGAIRRSDDIGLLAARGREGSLRVTRRPVVAVERAIDDRGDARSIRGLLFGAGIFARATEIGQRLSQSEYPPARPHPDPRGAPRVRSRTLGLLRLQRRARIHACGVRFGTSRWIETPRARTGSTSPR